jgi:hypothetical protein
MHTLALYQKSIFSIFCTYTHAFTYMHAAALACRCMVSVSIYRGRVDRQAQLHGDGGRVLYTYAQAAQLYRHMKKYIRPCSPERNKPRGNMPLSMC